MSTAYVAKIENSGSAVVVYDARTGRRIRTVGVSGPVGENVAVQTNGDIVTITDRRGIVKTYDAASGRCLRTI